MRALDRLPGHRVAQDDQAIRPGRPVRLEIASSATPSATTPGAAGSATGTPGGAETTAAASSIRRAHRCGPNCAAATIGGPPPTASSADPPVPIRPRLSGRLPIVSQPDTRQPLMRTDERAADAVRQSKHPGSTRPGGPLRWRCASLRWPRNDVGCSASQAASSTAPDLGPRPARSAPETASQRRPRVRSSGDRTPARFSKVG